MIYKKLFQPQTTLAIALSIVGVYGSLPVVSLATPVQAQSDGSIPMQANCPQTRSLGLHETYACLRRLALSPRRRTKVCIAAISNRQVFGKNGMHPSELSATSTTTRERATQPSFLRLQAALSQKELAEPGVAGGKTHQGGGSRAQNPSPVKDRGAPAPGQRVGGASRGRCLVARKPLTALVPIISATPDKNQHPVLANTPAGSVLALTVTSHPTFWFYFPSSLTSEHPVEFILKDGDNIIYQTVLSESGTTPGVVGFKLPDTVPPLEVNKRYNWFFSISCDRKQTNSTEQEEPLKIFVSGWVERVPIDPRLQQELEQATPQQKAILYVKADIWHEALTTLAELRRQKPDDVTLKEEWDNLLRKINLGALAEEPITSMLTPKQ